MAKRPVVVLSIAASDSGGGAGVAADLLTLSAHGVHGVFALTAVTAQDTHRITAVEPVSVELLATQIDAAFADMRPAAVKIGALYDTRRLRAVAEAMRRWKARNVVLDPVLAATGGETLLDRRAFGALRRELFPLCDLVTPNLAEARALAGISIRSETDRRLAAKILADSGAKAVLIKGGHARGSVLSDLLFDGRRFREFRHPRVATRATHGTGCTLSSAIAANLALGWALGDSVARAIRYLERGLRNGLFPGRGRGIPGHFLGARGGLRPPRSG